jgi:acyl-CoA ligase (AMP-forming) (exosortase A-associated)
MNSAALRPYHPTRLHELLESPAIKPAATAIIDGDASWTYAELRQQAQQMAQAIHAAGALRGDRVAVLLPKSLAECAALLAPSLVDAVVVPLNPVLKPAQVRHVLADCEARVLLTREQVLRGMGDERASLEALPGLQIVFLDESEALPAEPAAASQDADAPAAGAAAGAAANASSGPVAAALPPTQAVAPDLAAILYTSGSTGLPKGVMLTHANLLAGTRIVRNYLGITGADRILSVLPFSFDYGLNQWLTVLEQGALIVLLNFQLGDQIVRQLARHRITGLAGVPTVWAILTKAAPSLLKTPLPDLRYITNSGGAVPEATVRRLREILPATQIFLMYGLTEAFRSTFLPPSEVDHRPTSIGKAIPECEVFVVTADGRRAGPGEHGTLVHRGPTVSMGYWRRPEDTARVLRPNPLTPAVEGGETVCFSGDLAYADEDGFLYFVGRQDAMIKSAGYRISPSEVEDMLMSTGAFRQVAVIGLPDEWVGQRVAAVGVAADAGTTTEAVLAQASQQLPAHMVPARIDWVEALPTTPNGKVDYKLLVAQRSAPKP